MQLGQHRLSQRLNLVKITFWDLQSGQMLTELCAAQTLCHKQETHGSAQSERACLQSQEQDCNTSGTKYLFALQAGQLAPPAVFSIHRWG